METYILNIDTGGEICSVSISTPDAVIEYHESADKNSHSSQLAVITNQLLVDSSVKKEQLSAIAINKGPGSYTGLRIGASFAKGLCYALNIPLIAVDSLCILTKEFLSSYPQLDVDFICPMLDARRMEVYTALFDKQLNQVLPTQPLILDNNSFAEYSDKNVAYIGNGCSKFKFLVSDKYTRALFFDKLYPNAKALSSLSHDLFLKKQFEDIAYFEPQYLKDFVPTTIPKNKLS